MTELDQLWSQMLGDATALASGTDRRHVAEYLRLKATNDAIRTTGVGWLLDTFIEMAGHAVRDHFGVSIEREEPHIFARGASTMVGSLIEIRQGVRCLTVEAGWARTPSDGVMHKGALAFARITHFGMPKKNAELRLVHAETIPRWLADGKLEVDTAELRRHFDVFLDP